MFISTVLIDRTALSVSENSGCELTAAAGAEV